MTGTTTSKAAWIGIPLVLAAILAIINSISQGFLWEQPNSIANRDAAIAAKDAAIAAQTDANNKLEAALEQARAQIKSAQEQAAAMTTAATLTAQAQIRASQQQAQGLIEATKESVRAENSQYDQVMKPFISDPAEKLDELNKQIVRLQNEVELGFDSATGQALSDAERLKRTYRKSSLEKELKIQKETTSKNWKDAMEMMMGMTDGMLSGFGGLYGAPANRIPPERRIIQEQ